jgi:hypothetical protein
MKIRFSLVSSLFALFLFACKKDEQVVVTPTPFEFKSLTAEPTTIKRGETALLTAEATGEGLTYLWKATEGDILGSGAKVTFAAPSCCNGKREITCTVRDAAKKEEAKSITLTIE